MPLPTGVGLWCAHEQGPEEVFCPAAASPQLHFQPPPRKVFDTLIDDSGMDVQEPMASTRAVPRVRSKGLTCPQQQRKTPPAASAASSSSLKPVGRRRGSITTKKSREDLIADGSAEADELWRQEENDRFLDAQHQESLDLESLQPEEESRTWEDGEGDESLWEIEVAEESYLELPPHFAAPAQQESPLQDPAASPLLERGPPSESEIRERLTQAGGVAAFQRTLEVAMQPLQSVKLCFVGHARAGKTSTLSSLAGRGFDQNQPSTHGVATCSCSLARELLHPGTGFSPGDGRDEPWQELERTNSLSEFFEKTVAKTVAQAVSKENVDASTADSAPSPSSSSTSPSSSRRLQDLHVLKMPVDLIARAMSCEDFEEQHPVVLQTWDFAGQEIYYNMAHVFLTELGIYILVLDLSSWVEEKASGEVVDSLEFWLAALLVHAERAKLLVVGTHLDAVPEENREEVFERVETFLRGRLAAAPALGQQLFPDEERQRRFFPIDNRGGEGLEQLRRALNELALEAARERKIPTRWAHFFHVLDKLSTPYVTYEECRERAGQFGIVEGEMEEFLRLFHRLGLLLHFEGSPAIVLDPQWLLDAMAHVITCPRVLKGFQLESEQLQREGKLTDKLLSKLWEENNKKDNRFSLVEHQTILKAFLTHFDLLIVNDSAAKPQELPAYFVPNLVPKRPALEPPGVSCHQPTVEVFLDFQGILLRQLLPTLLLRIVGELRRCEASNLRVVSPVCQDQITFNFNSTLKVTLEMYPAANPQVVRATCRQLTRVNQESLKSFLELLRKALTMWRPRLTFALRVRCPLCQAAATEAMPHLISLEDVLREDVLYCDVTGDSVQDDQCKDYLHETLQHWRCVERRSNLEINNDVQANSHGFTEGASSSSERRMWFLYASPMALKIRCPNGNYCSKNLDPLDTQGELQGLTGEWEVRAATIETLSQALMARPAVLHITAHCDQLLPMRLPENMAVHAVQLPHLVVEDSSGWGKTIDWERLADLGPWEDVDLLVFTCCISAALGQALVDRGLKTAVVCKSYILDESARKFCHAFYSALLRKHPLAQCFKYGKEAVRNAAAPDSVRAQADDFVLLGRTSCDIDLGRQISAKVWWPKWARVEEFEGSGALTQLADHYNTRRRVVMLTGSEGIGKSAVCKEFCRFFSAPGRLFANCALVVDIHRLLSSGTPEDVCSTWEQFSTIFAQAVLEELQARASPKLCWAAEAEDGSPWKSLLSAARELEKHGKWLLVLDGLDCEVGNTTGLALVKDSLERLLEASSELNLLLVCRIQPKVFALRDCVVQMLGLMPLSDYAAVKLFIRRAQRHLTERDFDHNAEEKRLQGENLISKLLSSSVNEVTQKVPGRIIQVALRVTRELPSLLDLLDDPSFWAEAS